MSKETVKVYSHDGANITISEIPKEDIDNGRLVGKNFTDYDECKEDRDFTRRVEGILYNNSNSYRDRIDYLERKLNGKDNRVDSLSDKIDNIKKECKRGQDMLLGRIQEIELDYDLLTKDYKEVVSPINKWFKSKGARLLKKDYLDELIIILLSGVLLAMVFKI